MAYSDEGEQMKGGYTVSQDSKSGLWYCHMKGFPHIPCFGSFSEKKSDAMEYAKMYNNKIHKVNRKKDDTHEVS